MRKSGRNPSMMGGAVYAESIEHYIMASHTRRVARRAAAKYLNIRVGSGRTQKHINKMPMNMALHIMRENVLTTHTTIKTCEFI